MKKLLMILLGAMLVLSMAGVAGAAGVSNNDGTITYKGSDIPKSDDGNYNDFDGHTATVTLTLNEVFTFTLPAEFTLVLSTDLTHYSDMRAVGVDVTRLDAGHSIDIFVRSDNFNKNEDNKWSLVEGTLDENGFTEKASNPNYISYELGLGNSEAHIGTSSNTPISMVGNADAIVKTGIQSDLSGMYIHAKLPIPDSNTISSADYQDQLTFIVKVNTASTDDN